MRADMLTLADNAAAAEGKLYIHGGGISRITPPRLPWTHPMLTLVLRVEADDLQDLMRPHYLEFTLFDPSGHPVVGPGNLTLERPGPPPGLLPGEPLYAHVAVTMAPVNFSQEGLHEVHVDLDGDPAVRLPLPVGVPR